MMWHRSGGGNESRGKKRQSKRARRTFHRYEGTGGERRLRLGQAGMVEENRASGSNNR